MPNIYIDPIIITISDIDQKKFVDLMVFADENSYNPFNSKNNVITQRLPIPDKDESPQLVFYRKSKDGFFTSSEANKFHVINDKLWLVFFYDYNHENNEELVAVTVPNELGQYFIELLRLNGYKIKTWCTAHNEAVGKVKIAPNKQQKLYKMTKIW